MSANSAIRETQLQHIEDLAAAGFSHLQIAEDLLLKMRTFQRMKENNPKIDEAIKRGESRFASMSDRERRARLEADQLDFVPSPIDEETIKKLAAIGWPELTIAQELKVGPLRWVEAKKKFPSIVDALREGMADSGTAGIERKIRQWMPRPEDLEEITRLASEGQTQEVISVNLGLPTKTLRAKLETFPLLREAYDAGCALFEQARVQRLIEASDNGKFPVDIFMLKARASGHWTDRPPTAAERDANNRTGPKKRFEAPPAVSNKEQMKDALKLREKYKVHLTLISDNTKQEAAGG